MVKQMSTEELLGLPVTVDLETAGRAFGLGRTKSYQLARAGEFPVPILPLGARFRVRKTDIMQAVGIADLAADAARSEQGAA